MNEWLSLNPVLVSIISIALNILIAITGILPSAFLTVGTVGVLGFKIGLIILIVGEATGAVMSFILYRKGVHKLLALPQNKKFENKFLRKLKDTRGIEAFLMVILLRVLPFVPSGVVTLTAAISKMGMIPFSLASTLGKIPALYVEAYSMVYVLNLKRELQLGLIIFVTVFPFLYFLWKRNTKKQ